MIENIKVTNYEGDSIIIYPDSDLSQLHGFYEYIKAINWTNNYSTFKITDQGEFHFHPIFATNKIAVIWNSHSIYKHPSNLVIYNADATVYKIVDVPEIINKELLEAPTFRKKHSKYANFDGLKDIHLKSFLIVQIDSHIAGPFAGSTSIEKRALDVETGEFDPTWSQVVYW